MPDYVACNLCGADDTKLVTNKTRYNTSCTIVRCRRCGLVYMNPRPTEHEITEFYSKGYRDLYNPSDTLEEYDNKRIPTAIEKLQFVQKTVIQYNIQGRNILDIGCATGNFLYLLINEGWETIGIEPDSGYANYAEKNGIAVLNGTLESVELPKKHFDVITLFQTLEHFFDPVGSLVKVSKALKDTGILIIEVPNINHLKFRVINKEPIDDYFQPAHTFYFSPRTLRRILEKSGFRADSLKTRVGYELPMDKRLKRIIKDYLTSPYQSAIITVSRFDNWVRSRFGFGLYITALARKKIPEEG